MEQYRYCSDTNFICPEETIMNDLTKCLFKKDYLGKEIRENIGKLLLAKIDQSKIFNYIAQFSINYLQDNKKIDHSFSEAARLECISQKTNKFIICVETYLHTLYCLRNDIELEYL